MHIPQILKKTAVMGAVLAFAVAGSLVSTSDAEARYGKHRHHHYSPSNHVARHNAFYGHPGQHVRKHYGSHYGYGHGHGHGYGYGHYKKDYYRHGSHHGHHHYNGHCLFNALFHWGH